MRTVLILTVSVFWRRRKAVGSCQVEEVLQSGLWWMEESGLLTIISIFQRLSRIILKVPEGFHFLK